VNQNIEMICLMASLEGHRRVTPSLGVVAVERKLQKGILKVKYTVKMQYSQLQGMAADGYD